MRVPARRPSLTDAAAGSRHPGAPAAGRVTPAPAGHAARSDGPADRPDRRGAGGSAAPAPGPGPADAGAAGPACAALPLLAQLPADIPDFTGRAGHLHALRDLLSGPGRPDSPGAVVVAAVIGAGGLGKTTLAVHAAHLLRAQYPDGQLYANLQGASAPGLRPSEVLARFLRDLGMDPARIPADAEERAAQYRTRLTDRQVLIVLDDARDAAQVRPLLPGSASCAVLVTTRNRMPDLAGSRFVDLDVLGPGEARDMFAGIIGPSRADAEPGGHRRRCWPPAPGCRWPSGSPGPGWPPGAAGRVRNLARRLSDERRRLDELKTGDLAVRACFEVSFTSLPGPARPDGVDPAHAFRLLGLWQGPSIGLPAAAALIGQPEDAVADALEVLVDAQLLQSPAPDRYRFHDLLRAYAAERALAEEPGPGREAAVRRVLAWYLHTVVAMATLVSPHRDQVRARAARAGLAAAELRHRGGGAELVRRRAGESGRRAAAGRRLGYGRPRRGSCRSPRSASSTGGATGPSGSGPTASPWPAPARPGTGRGEALGAEQSGHGARAAAAARRHRLFRAGAGYPPGDRATGSVRRRRRTTSPIPTCCSAGSRHWTRCRTHSTSSGGPGTRYGEAIALTNLGEAYLHLGRTDDAVGSLQQAREIFAAVGDARGEGYAMHHLGQALLDRGEIRDALGQLGQALAIRQASGERLAEAQTLRLLGTAQLAAGRADECRRSWTRAISLFEALEDQPQADEVRSGLSGIEAGGPVRSG